MTKDSATRAQEYTEQVEDADRQLKAMKMRAQQEEEQFSEKKSLSTSTSSEDIRSSVSSNSATDDLPTGILTLPYGTCGPERYENCFHRVKLMRSEIVVERGITRRLAECGKDIIPAICHDSKNYLLTDTIIDGLYGDRILNGLRAAGLQVHKIVVPADDLDETGESSGERFKTLKVFSDCVDQILENGIDKRSAIISLGGGVVNNIAGFISASLYRGINLIHISTTTMGQVDAAIDFKQAVNHHKGKNLLGAYHPAAKIILDPELLVSLSRRHILNGISESIKHAITQSQEMLDYIIENRGMMDDKDKIVDYLESIIRMTIAHKVPTLSGDTDDDYNEMLPQYGHAIGHAIEFLSLHMPESDRALLHGEAIAIGMCITAEVAYLLGVCSKEIVDKHYEVFEEMELPVFIPTYMSAETICNKMCYDKHYVKQPTMGLAIEIGEMYEKDGAYGHSIAPETLQEALRRNLRKRDDRN